MIPSAVLINQNAKNKNTSVWNSTVKKKKEKNIKQKVLKLLCKAHIC